MMSPGTYLRKRRAQRGLTLREVALELAALPEAVRAIDGSDLLRLEARLAEVEADAGYLQPAQAGLLSLVVPMDASIYEQLFTLHHAGAGASDTWGLPQPQICRGCACTWHDPCHTPAGPCGWSAADPELCTACESPLPASFRAPRPTYHSIFAGAAR